MIGMDSKNVMLGKVIVILPNKKPCLVDIKAPKNIKPLPVAPQFSFVKPMHNPSEIQKSIICFA